MLNLKSAIIWSIFLQLLSLALYSVFNQTNLLFLGLAIIVIALCSFLYFINNEVSAFSGLKLGVTFLVTGLILDFIFPIYLIATGNKFVGADIITTYSQWQVWLALVEVLLVPILIGYLLSKPKLKEITRIKGKSKHKLIPWAKKHPLLAIIFVIIILMTLIAPEIWGPKEYTTIQSGEIKLDEVLAETTLESATTYYVDRNLQLYQHSTKLFYH